MRKQAAAGVCRRYRAGGGMNENIQFAIGKLQEANMAAVTAQFNLREATTIYESSISAENDASVLVRKREQELVKAVRENLA